MNLAQLRDTLVEFIQPLDAALAVGPSELARELGYDLTPVADSLDEVSSVLTSCSSSTKAFADALLTVASADEVSADMIVELGTTTLACLESYRNLSSAFDAVPTEVTAHIETIMGGASVSEFAEEFAERLVGLLSSIYLEKKNPQLRSAFNVLGVLTQRNVAADPMRHRLSQVASRLQLEGITGLIANPKQWLADRYTVGATVSLELLVDTLRNLLLTQMYWTSRIRPTQSSISSVGRLLPTAQLATAQPMGVSADIFTTRDPASALTARIMPLQGLSPSECGVVAEFDVQGGIRELRWSPTDSFGFSVSSDSSATLTARAVFFSGQTPALELTSSGTVGPMRGQLYFQTPRDLLDLTFKGIGGFRIDRIGVALGIEFDPDSENELFAELELSGAELRVGGSSTDGFLKKIFPGEGVHGTFDLTMGISSLRGLYASGSGGLELTLPIHQDLGPIRLDSIYVGTFATPPDLELRCGVSLSGQIGPVAASVERIGARIMLPTGGGDPAIRFLPPIGAGLAIAAGPVAGGGYVAHDEALSRYAGILDLKLGEIGLVAIALITTKLPGGRDGYALFVNIGVTFSPAITLPYNFNLKGVGGLLALHRTMDVEALRSGLKTKTLDSILFPEDPILNASKIISDSERVFPIEEGRFVVGPMAKLGWGANGLIVADIAIVIELPAPIVIAVLGQLVAKFPKSDDAKVVLRLDVLGILDVAKRELSIDATLYDSRIITYELSGDSALRLRWGSNPVFALSVGGFHPKFSPPPNFPTLKRLTLELSSSNSFELTATAYHALTSNTLQLGAKVKLHAEACGAELNSNLSFDGMVVFSPFAFEVGISGGAAVSYRGHDLSSVHLSVDLSGPNPWHAKGKAKFSVACFDVTAKFNKTWGNEDAATLAKVDPLQPFLDELAVESNWSATVIPRRSAVESLKSLEPGTSGAPLFLAHPAGGLEVRQRLLPLGIKLELFRNAEVKNHERFDITLQLLRGTDSVPADELDPDDVLKEHFARGQYKELSKSDRLSQASYEKFRAGTRVTPKLARLDGRIEEVDLQFESILIRPDGYTERNEQAAGPRWSKARRALRLAAMQRANARRRGLGRFMTGVAPRVEVAEEGYVIVDKATLQRATAAHPDTDPAYTLTEALDRVEDLIENGTIIPDAVMVIPEFEVQAA